MYHLFLFHHVLPSEYRKLGTGEKRVLRAFIYRQIKDMAGD